MVPRTKKEIKALERECIQLWQLSREERGYSQHHKAVQAMNTKARMRAKQFVAYCLAKPVTG